MDPMNLIKVKQEVQDHPGQHHLTAPMDMPVPPIIDHSQPGYHHVDQPKLDESQAHSGMEEMEGSMNKMDHPSQSKMAAPAPQINPWHVPWDEFLYYCCPECDTKVKDYEHFYAHAIQYHEQAKMAAGMSEQQSLQPQIKEEIMDYDFDPTETLKTELEDEDIDEEDDEDEEYDIVPKVKGTKYQVKEKLSTFQCYFCSALFDSSADVKDHIEQVHHPDHPVNGFMYGKELKYQCSECKLMHKTDENLKLHICGTLPPTWIGIKMVGDTKFQCPKCDSEFVTYRRMLEHQ